MTDMSLTFTPHPDMSPDQQDVAMDIATEILADAALHIRAAIVAASKFGSLELHGDSMRQRY